MKTAQGALRNVNGRVSLTGSAEAGRELWLPRWLNEDLPLPSFWRLRGALLMLKVLAFGTGRQEPLAKMVNANLC